MITNRRRENTVIHDPAVNPSALNIDEYIALGMDDENHYTCTCNPVSPRHERIWEEWNLGETESALWGVHSASAALRQTIAERDNWTCHRCTLPVSIAHEWPHPLAAVADHYPITRKALGPTIACNLRLAHNMCNNPAFTVTDVIRYSITGKERHIINQIMSQPRWNSNH